MIAISMSAANGNDEDAVGEVFLIDDEGYIRPYLENTANAGNFTGNLSSNNTSIIENTSEDGENSSNIGETLLIDDEGYFGHYLANLSNNSSINATNMSLDLDAYEPREISYYPDIYEERLIMDTGFEKGLFKDFQGIMDNFGGFMVDDFFDGRRHLP